MLTLKLSQCCLVMIMFIVVCIMFDTFSIDIHYLCPFMFILLYYALKSILVTLWLRLSLYQL